MKIRLAKRYAEALFHLASSWHVLHEVEGELTQVEEVFGEAQVRDFFENPSVPATVKRETLARLFGSSVSGLVHNFLCLMVDKRRGELLVEVIKVYRELVKKASNILEVEVITAIALAEEDREQLAVRLAYMTGKEIELKPRVDSQILGGIILQIGDKRLDNSVVAKLAKLKSHLQGKYF